MAGGIYRRTKNSPLQNVVLLDSSREAWLPLRSVAKPTNAAVRRLVGRPAPRRSGGRSGECWRGGHHLCAHPNSLPYASKAGNPPGFQIELGEVLAKGLGVSLVTEWIVVPSQAFRADCDIILDAIADPEAQADTGLRISKPYYRSGVGLAVPGGSAITTFASLNEHTKVGVQVGSVAAMLLNQPHVRTSTFGFEEDMLAALAAGEIDAAAVTPLAAGYYNLNPPFEGFAILPPDEAEHDLVWNAAVGIRKPDERFLPAIDAALDRLRADGTVETIYAKYGIALLPPRYRK